MTTKFAFEVPFHNLQDFEDLQDFHFVVSTHCRVEAYRDYYIKQSERSLKRIWLDNGFNEKGKADTPAILFKYFHMIHADRVIAPDSIKWSCAKLLASFHKMARLIPSYYIIIVANCPEAVDMAYMHNIRQIAIPFRIRKDWPLLYTDRLEGQHFLGLNSIDEIKRYRPSSLDTSLPIRLAIRNVTMRQWHERGCPREGLWHKDQPNYFNWRLNPLVVDRARSNIMELKEVGK